MATAIFYKFDTETGVLESCVKLNKSEITEADAPVATSGKIIIRLDQGLPRSARKLSADGQAVLHVKMEESGDVDECGSPIQVMVEDVGRSPIVL